jgi:4-amino-4-deoxy-L-arabinose transferase-like glycosyltransferase
MAQDQTPTATTAHTRQTPAQVLGAKLATAALALAALIGLAGAWVGLDASSLWMDELFTRWVVTGDGAGDTLLQRIGTDVHPPLYYLLIAAWSAVFGASDMALRTFSAALGCAAILIFTLGTARVFSLRARLFAAALATCSGFWFFQAQNARDYTLSLVLVSIVLALGLRLLAERDSPKSTWRLALLAAVTGLGALTHFYLTYVSLAALGVLFLYLPRRRIALVVLAVALLAIDLLYTRLVIARFAQYALKDSWIQGDWAWNRSAIEAAGRASLGKFARPALLLLLALAIVRGLTRRRETLVAALRPTAIVQWLRNHPIAVLCLAVPPLVVCAGLASSMLISPNMTDRNLLVCSPFLWGACAVLFDLALAGAAGWLPIAGQAALATLALLGSGIVLGRPLPRTEPFKEAAAWIRAQPACRGARIPTLDGDRKAWARPAFSHRTETAVYSRYLAGYATPGMLYAQDILAGRLPPDLPPELSRRLKGQGCPVLLWSNHGAEPEMVAAAARILAGGAKVRTIGFSNYTYDVRWEPAPTLGYLVVASDEGEPPHAR